MSTASAIEGRTVELILDASGSMAGKLDDGTVKIVAAREAVERFIKDLPQTTVIAFRAYGHQSAREEHNRQDTQVLVGFGSAAEQSAKILTRSKELRARGYTPISYVLEQAARDFHREMTGERAIILVSDGKETCDGDPCSVARALHESQAQLVIHTVGFGVDEATRGQRECIASVTGGTYFPAQDAGTLGQVLGAAVETASVTPKEEAGMGFLEVESATIQGHQVSSAVSGEVVGNVSSVTSVIELPAGIYNVTVGSSLWKSVEVRTGEKTVLSPGQLTVENASLQGHRVTNSETGQEHGRVGAITNWTALLPGEYDVWFGPLAWRIHIRAGEELQLRPGWVQVKGADIRGHKVRTSAGQEVGAVSATTNWIPLPPGAYTIEIDGKTKSFTLTEAQEVEFRRE
ncbi:MAG: VWA domain-containing protein [Acidobacteriota bacterium]|nr:MAG: VWA domain-containing protein [Acidobacteriota bacterium]